MPGLGGLIIEKSMLGEGDDGRVIVMSCGTAASVPSTISKSKLKSETLRDWRSDVMINGEPKTVPSSLLKRALGVVGRGVRGSLGSMSKEVKWRGRRRSARLLGRLENGRGEGFRRGVVDVVPDELAAVAVAAIVEGEGNLDESEQGCMSIDPLSVQDLFIYSETLISPGPSDRCSYST